VDSNEIEASCLFCPYAVDKNKWFQDKQWSSCIYAVFRYIELQIVW
jgi:hypothetical protein